jgi:hypothetical protein
MKKLTWILGLALSMGALAADNYAPLGEVLSHRSSASFDATSVRGPLIAMYKEDEGRWVGRLGGEVIAVDEVKNGVRGAGTALYLERAEDAFIVRGHIGYRTVYVKVPDSPQLRYQYGWTLTGLANTERPPTAQYIFAVLGAL